MGLTRDELNQQFGKVVSAEPCDTALVDELLNQGAEVGFSDYLALNIALRNNHVALLEVLIKYLDFAARDKKGATVLEIILGFCDPQTYPRLNDQRRAEVLDLLLAIDEETTRNKIIAQLIVEEVEFVALFRSYERYPKSGKRQDERTFAAAHCILKLAKKKYWSSILFMTPFFDKDRLGLVIKGDYFTFIAKTELGMVFTQALLADTHESLEVANQLLDLGVSIDECAWRMREGHRVIFYPIHHAAHKKNFELLRKLLKAGADANHHEVREENRTKYFVNVLTILVENDSGEFIQELLKLSKEKIEPGILSDAIRAAIAINTPKASSVIRLLLQEGADLTQKVRRETLLDMAVARGNKEAIAELLSFNAKPNLSIPDRRHLKKLGGEALVAAYVELENKSKMKKEGEAARERAEEEAEREHLREIDERQLSPFGRATPAWLRKALVPKIKDARDKDISVSTEDMPQNTEEERRFQLATLQVMPFQVEKTKQENVVTESIEAQEKWREDLFFSEVNWEENGNARFLQDFITINEDYLQDHFLAGKALTEEGCLAAIDEQKTKHPNGPVAISVKLANKYPGRCQATNDDFLIDLWIEKFKHEKLWAWCRPWKLPYHAVLHKGKASQLTFFRSSSLEKYVGGLSADERREIAAEMRVAALDEKNQSRSARLVREVTQ